MISTNLQNLWPKSCLFEALERFAGIRMTVLHRLKKRFWVGIILLTPGLLNEGTIPSRCKVTSMVQPFLGVAVVYMCNNLIVCPVRVTTSWWNASSGPERWEWIDQNQGCPKKLNQVVWRRNNGLRDEGSEERWSLWPKRKWNSVRQASGVE